LALLAVLAAVGGPYDSMGELIGNWRANAADEQHAGSPKAAKTSQKRAESLRIALLSRGAVIGKCTHPASADLADAATKGPRLIVP